MFIVSLINDITFQLKSRLDGSKSSSSYLFYAGTIYILMLDSFMYERLNSVNITSLKLILTFPEELISVMLPKQAYYLLFFVLLFFINASDYF